MEVAGPLDDVVPVYALMAEPGSLPVVRWLPYPSCIQSVAGYRGWHSSLTGEDCISARGYR